MKRGFTLLVSVLVVSIMLAVSLGVSNIIRTEIILANTGRQSQIAFYAADAGVECAIYWDTVHSDGDYISSEPSPFATSTIDIPDNDKIDCGDDVPNAQFDVGETDKCVNSMYPTFEDGLVPGPCPPPINLGGGRFDEPDVGGKSVFEVEFVNGSCARVTVIKRQDSPTNPAGTIETLIHADGFSNQNCDASNPRVFQRSLETTTYD